MFCWEYRYRLETASFSYSLWACLPWLVAAGRGCLSTAFPRSSGGRTFVTIIEPVRFVAALKGSDKWCICVFSSVKLGCVSSIPVGSRIHDLPRLPKLPI